MKNLTILTLDEPEISDYALSRNKLLGRAKTEWVLFLDKDESLSPELEHEIKSTIRSPRFDAYRIPRQDTFLGRTLRHGETAHVRPVRLARLGWGKWHRPVHEVWQGQGRVGELTHPLLHTPHKSLAEFVTKIDRYSELEANYRYANHKHSSLLHIATYPLAKWLYNYIILRGFLDGAPGLIHATMMSWHSYLTWSKLYLLWRQK